jgi:hypothetical protein
MIELTNAEAHRLASFLARVVPRGHDEQDEIHGWVVRLTRKPFAHHRDLMAPIQQIQSDTKILDA